MPSNKAGGPTVARPARLVRARRLTFEALEPRAMLAVSVTPTVETVADPGGEDDIAIWIHPTDPALSRFIGTVKTSANSLRVYNLQGQQVQSVAVPQVNNVDLRYNFQLSGHPVTMVAGSDRANNSIVLYTMDAGGLQNVAARTISTGMSVYGLGMYVSPSTGKYYVFVTAEGSGQVQQWELFDNGAGLVDARLVRSLEVGSQVEGIVADDELGYLYVGEEDIGIWKYSAEPTGGSTRTRVDATGASGHLTADVEGLTIYYAANGMGYLIASSQGNSQFALYRRDGVNAYINSFSLVAGGGIDAVTNTDGIDVTNYPLNSQFSQGMFVAQDNDDNFKLVRWEAIDAALGGALTIDTAWDPRAVGQLPDPSVSRGDYNHDGQVDAADYVVWRQLAGASSIPAYSGADGNGDSRISSDDYAVWRSHFGQQSGLGAGRGHNMKLNNVRPPIALVNSAARDAAMLNWCDSQAVTAPTAPARAQSLGLATQDPRHISPGSTSSALGDLLFGGVGRVGRSLHHAHFDHIAGQRKARHDAAR